MFKRIFVISLFLISFYGMSSHFFTVVERRGLLALIMIFAIIVFFLGPSFYASEHKKNIDEGKEFEIIDKQWGEGEYHNDFTRVGSSTDQSPVRPVDYAGDAVAHGRETLKEDLKVIEIHKDEK